MRLSAANVTDADLIAALLARCGGRADLGRKELENTHGWRIVVARNHITGDVSLTLEEA